jgi:hypothetical protein
MTFGSGKTGKQVIRINRSPNLSSLMSPGIYSKKSILPVYVALRAGTITLFVVTGTDVPGVLTPYPPPRYQPPATIAVLGSFLSSLYTITVLRRLRACLST